MKKLALIGSLILLFVFLTSLKNAAYASEIIKPILTWQRSTESQDKVVTETVIGSKVNEALALPLDPNQTVFDNGISTPSVNKAKVPFGNQWASWTQYSASTFACGPVYDLRHFQAKFNLQSGMTVTKVMLASPYYMDGSISNVVPVNDNAYIFINGTEVKRVGTSYSAVNRGTGGNAPIANETDGWIANGDLGSGAVALVHSGENIIDIVAGEWCRWGGLGKLELRLEVESKFPLAVPYLSQKDPAWGSQIYDHASTIGPFFCGTTLAQCGCAVTSAAMLLKYYGVDKSPDGLPTNPQTLNNWLKNRKFGYSQGAINWIELTRYAFESNSKFGTPKIDYLGPITNRDDNSLNLDLNNQKPVILEVTSNIGSHFLLASGITGNSYYINDPISQNNKYLSAYNDIYKGMRRYELTNTNLSAIMVSINLKGSIFVLDPIGRKLGVDPITNQFFQEIDNGHFYYQDDIDDDSLDGVNTSLISIGGISTIEILDPLPGRYSIYIQGQQINADLITYDANADVKGGNFSLNGLQKFEIDYSNQNSSLNSITKIVTIDLKPESNINKVNLKSNGVLPIAVLSDANFDALSIDLSSIKFDFGNVIETHEKGHYEDVDNDGDKDLVLHIKISDLTQAFYQDELCLKGETRDGKHFKGCDALTF